MKRAPGTLDHRCYIGARPEPAVTPHSSPPKLTVLTWLWRQPGGRTTYSARHVNAWANGIEANLTLPHELACVTDMPDGIDSRVRIIPLPREFNGLKTLQWRPELGLPQCYRRITLFAADAFKRFEAQHIVSMDLDCVIVSNLDSLFSGYEQFRMFKGTSGKRPYNGSMLMLQPGVYPHVFDMATPENIEAAGKLYVGSDQAFISYALGGGLPVWSKEDGVHAYTPSYINSKQRDVLQPGSKLIFFPGVFKPWALGTRHKHIMELWERYNV